MQGKIQQSSAAGIAQNDMWSAGRVIQYFLITIAIAAIGYTGNQMSRLALTITDMDSRLIRLEANVSGLVSAQIKEINADIKDHEGRIRRLENERNQ